MGYGEGVEGEGGSFGGEVGGYGLEGSFVARIFGHDFLDDDMQCCCEWRRVMTGYMMFVDRLMVDGRIKRVEVKARCEMLMAVVGC